MEGQRLLLLRLLNLKFGELSERVTARVAAASEAELTRWSEAVLSAESLEAVLGASD